MTTKSQNKKKKILIIDDEVAFTEQLSYYLRERGFTVYVANTGIEGIKTAQSKKPNLILLDIALPDVEAREVMEELKKRQIKTHVIMVTADTSFDSVTKFSRAGASDYMMKPINAEELLMNIERSLELGVSIERQKTNDELKQINKQLTTENDNLRSQLLIEQEEHKKIQTEIAISNKRSRLTGYAIRTFYIIISSVITWLFFRSGIITDTRLLFLLPLVLFIVLLLPIERVQRISTKYKSTETTVDVRPPSKEDHE